MRHPSLNRPILDKPDQKNSALAFNPKHLNFQAVKAKTYACRQTINMLLHFYYVLFYYSLHDITTEGDENGQTRHRGKRLRMEAKAASIGR